MPTAKPHAPRSKPRFLRDIGEEGAWRIIEPFIARSGQADVLAGFGDDAAAVEAATGAHLLLTADMLVEGVHFRREFIGWGDLGCKAIAVNASDIAAMGGRPRHALVSIGLPGDFRVDDLRALYRGMAAEARRHGAVLAGGDTVRSARVVISVTLTGASPRTQPLALRSHCRAGQHLYVTGTLGDSAAGLALLARKRFGRYRGESWAANLIRRHRLPAARVKAAQSLAGAFGDLAMIDVSDALRQECHLLASASGVRVEVEARRLPLSPGMKKFAQAAAEDPLAYALDGGEDYELLFATAAPVQHVRATISKGTRLTRIGRIMPGPAAVDIHGGGRAGKPFAHF